MYLTEHETRVYEWLKTQGYSYIKPEFTYGNSRFDFYMEKNDEKYLLEVKGCTLEIDGIGYFPDAPTERGAKHLHELIEAKKAGFRACVLFVIAMKGCDSFAANSATDPKFEKALFEAKEAGVEIFAVDCKVTTDGIFADERIPVCFSE